MSFAQIQRLRYLTLRSQLVAGLAAKADREQWLRHRVEAGLARQVFRLRSYAGLTQSQMALVLGKPQSVISRLESPGYGRYSLGTLLDLAERFDVGLLAEFVPFSELIEREVAETVRGRQMREISPWCRDRLLDPGFRTEADRLDTAIHAPWRATA
jgi:transcriptional regulator with XRE-family HTH domain